MPKRIKPSDLVSNEASNLPANSNAPMAENKEAFTDVSLVGNGTMTAEARDKLEKYDALEASVAALSKEKAMLEAKVAEYAEKLTAKPSSKSTVNNTKLAEAEKKISMLD